MFYKNKKIINISSARRLQGTPYDFTVAVDIPSDSNFTHASIIEAQIPKSYYLFSSEDDLNLRITEATGPLLIDAAIIPGNYDVYTLAAELQRSLTAGSAGTGNAWTYTVIYDPLISNFTITSGAGDFEITTSNSNNPYLMRVLGFDNPAAGDMFSIGGSLNGNDVVDLERTAEITIRSNVAQNFNTDDVAMLYPDSYAQNSMIQYAPSDPYAYSLTLTNNRAKVFRFQLFDDQGKALVLEDAVRLKVLFFEVPK